MDRVRGTALFPPNNLPLFGGIRDAAPDAWGRRVIESRLKVPANSLPESSYLLHAGSQRVGAIDIRSSRDSAATLGFGTWDNLEYLMDAAHASTRLTGSCATRGNLRGGQRARRCKAESDGS